MDTPVLMEIIMSNENKPVYVLCPRCELNYIKSTEKLCDVCKVEMGLLEKSFLIADEDLEAESGKLCPVCHANYIGEDEEMCFVCQKEKDAKEQAEESEEDNWTYVEEEEEIPPEEMEISLELTAEEEDEEEEDELFDENAYKEVDDFNYDVDPKDFEDYDEEEDEEEDDDL